MKITDRVALVTGAAAGIGRESAIALAKTDDGRRPDAWLEPLIGGTTLLQPQDIADAVVEIIGDDHLAGACILVDNPPAQPARLAVVKNSVPK